MASLGNTLWAPHWLALEIHCRPTVASLGNTKVDPTYTALGNTVGPLFVGLRNTKVGPTYSALGNNLDTGQMWKYFHARFFQGQAHGKRLKKSISNGVHGNTKYFHRGYLRRPFSNGGAWK